MKELREASSRQRQAEIRNFAARHRLKAFAINGIVEFPIYACSGGLSSKWICYFVKHEWPINGADLGREKTAHKNVLAVEFVQSWNRTQIRAHLEETLAKYRPGWTSVQHADSEQP